MVRWWLLLDVYCERLVMRRIDLVREVDDRVVSARVRLVVGHRHSPVKVFVFVPQLLLDGVVLVWVRWSIVMLVVCLAGFRSSLSVRPYYS